MRASITPGQQKHPESGVGHVHYLGVSVGVSPCSRSHHIPSDAYGAALGLCACSSADRHGPAELTSLTSLRYSKTDTPTLSCLLIFLHLSIFQRPPENRGDFGWAPEEDSEQRPVHASTDESVSDLDGMTSLVQQGGDGEGTQRKGRGGRGETDGRRGAPFGGVPPLPGDCDCRRRVFLELISNW